MLDSELWGGREAMTGIWDDLFLVSFAMLPRCSRVCYCPGLEYQEPFLIAYLTHLGLFATAGSDVRVRKSLAAIKLPATLPSNSKKSSFHTPWRRLWYSGGALIRAA